MASKLIQKSLLLMGTALGRLPPGLSLKEYLKGFESTIDQVTAHSEIIKTLVIGSMVSTNYYQ